jgi:hypothetical protein
MAEVMVQAKLGEARPKDMVFGVSFDGVLELIKLNSVGYFEEDIHDGHFAAPFTANSALPGEGMASLFFRSTFILTRIKASSMSLGNGLFGGDSGKPVEPAWGKGSLILRRGVVESNKCMLQTSKGELRRLPPAWVLASKSRSEDPFLGWAVTRNAWVVAGLILNKDEGVADETKQVCVFAFNGRTCVFNGKLEGG